MGIEQVKHDGPVDAFEWANGKSEGRIVLRGDGDIVNVYVIDSDGREVSIRVHRADIVLNAPDHAHPVVTLTIRHPVLALNSKPEEP